MKTRVERTHMEISGLAPGTTAEEKRHHAQYGTDIMPYGTDVLQEKKT